MIKPIFSKTLPLVLTAALLTASLPVPAQASETDGLCKHHPAHTDDCGYLQSGSCAHICTAETGCVTALCAHTHVGTCYDHLGQLLCTHSCGQESGCGQKVTDCVHTEHGGCGHSERQPCDFAVNGCELCRQEDGNDLTQIKGTDVTVEGYSFAYTGQEICPQITVTVNGVALTEDIHYTLHYENNIAAGTASVTVNGMEDAGYTGIVTVPFTIEAPEFTLVEIKASDVHIEGTVFPYTGEAIEPAVTVTVNGKLLAEGKDYSLTYENNIQPGTASVTVRGIGTASMTLGYTGEVTVTFTVAEAEKPDAPEDSEEPEDSEKPENSEKPEENPEETEPVSYKITKGNRATWYQNSGKTLSFTVSADGQIPTGISINGRGLEKQYYSVKGNTVTLTAGFLNKLTVGKYSIAVHYEDADAEGTFFVSDKLDLSNPATGDTGGIGFWMLSGLISLAALGGAVFVLRRKMS